MSIVYNEYAEKWVVSFLDCEPGSGAPLVVCYSSKLTSGWSKPVALFENSGDTANLYGGYLNERWVENNGETYYFIYSRWDKINGVYRSYIAKASVTKVDLNAKK